MSTVIVEGVGELVRAFGRFDKDLRRDLRSRLVEIAGMVAVTARQMAEQLGLDDTGQLIAKIRPGFRSSYAYITDTAKRTSNAWPEGYNYPAVYEYGRGGSRAFLGPAAKADEPAVIASLESLLDRLALESGF